MHEEEDTTDSNDSAQARDDGDALHSLDALEVPHREEHVAEHGEVGQEVRRPHGGHGGDRARDAEQKSEAGHKQRALDQQHTPEGSTHEIVVPAVCDGNAFGRGQVEAVVGEDGEVLRKGLSDCDQAVVAHTEYTDEVRQHQHGQNVVQTL